MISTLIEQLMIALGGITQKQMSEILKVSIDRVKSLANGRAKNFSIEEMQTLLKDVNVRAEWLITGEGEIFNNKSVVLTPTIHADPFEEEFCLVYAYDIYASAGGGSLVQDERPKSRMAFRRDWLQLQGLKEDDLCVIYAKGDSMEPTISNNDALLVDSADKNMYEGCIYVMRVGEMLWVKRIQWVGVGQISLISDNDAYQPIQLEFKVGNEIAVIGRVVNVSKEF